MQNKMIYGVYSKGKLVAFTHLTHIMSAPIHTLLNQHTTASAGSTPLGAARQRSHRSLHTHNLSTP